MKVLSVAGRNCRIVVGTLSQSKLNAVESAPFEDFDSVNQNKCLPVTECVRASLPFHSHLCNN